MGTLIQDALTPAKRIWFFSTETGIAPFASIVYKPETYERLDEAILTHTCRNMTDSTSDRELIHQTKNDILVGEGAQKNAVLSNNTLETSPKTGRITSLLKGGS